MRFTFTSTIGLFLVLAFLPLKAKDWSLEVVPYSSAQGKQYIQVHDLFYVVLTNDTDHDLTVWKEWCSWGYFNLAFDFTGNDGKIVHVQKRGDQYWTKNSPDAYVVGAGKHFVLVVTLKPEDWLNTQNLDGPMVLKAIYENTNQAFPGKKPASTGNAGMDALIKSGWVGKVESDPIPVTVVR
jgi:hypothetical protein